MYSKKRDGKIQLSANFRVEEFACKDGNDTIYIDDELVLTLQKIRNQFGKPVNINSGYRTAAYNAKIGGSPNSQHVNGKAADIRVTDNVPLQVAKYAESIGVGGIGHAPDGQGNYVHVDTRTVKSRWEYYNNGKSTRTVSGFGGTAIPQPATNTSIAIETKSIFVNGQEKTIRAGLVDDENYGHLRDFIAAMGGSVSYDDETKKISITS